MSPAGERISGHVEQGLEVAQIASLAARSARARAYHVVHVTFWTESLGVRATRSRNSAIFGPHYFCFGKEIPP